MKSEFEKSLGTIRKRRWDELKNEWLRFIPDFAEAGEPPDPPLGEIIDFSR